MNAKSPSKQLGKALGIIDALFNGFELVFRRPAILLIPVALDLFLWLGPAVTAAPLFQHFIAWLGSTQPANATPEMVQSFNAARSEWLKYASSFNVLSIAALTAIGMPTLMALDAPSVSLLATRLPGFEIRDPRMLALAFGALIALGILIGSAYLEIIARGIRKEQAGWQSYLTHTLKAYLKITVLILSVLLLSLIAMLPFVFSAALIGIFSQDIASILFMVGVMLLVWAALYLAFVVPAIFVSRVGVWQAILNSISVFRHNLWSALALISLAYLIQMGFQFIWQGFGASAWGVLVADIANAFLGSSLIAALMLFYQDRITRLIQVREQIRQQRPTQ